MPKPRKPRRTRLEKLQNSWEKASPAERAAFMNWVSQHGGEVPLAPAPLATGRYLTPLAIDRIMRRMRSDGLELSTLKTKIGLPPEDPSLARALVSGASLRLSVIVALENWLKRDPLGEDYP